MALFEIDGLVVDEETGEIVEAPVGGDALTMVAVRRHYAHEQEKTWERARQGFDRVLLARQDTPKATYADVMVAVRGRTYSDTDVEAFADMVIETPLEPSEMAQLIAAAKGFKRDLLPERLRPLFDSATAARESKPWIESRAVLKPAPTPKEVATT